MRPTSPGLSPRLAAIGLAALLAVGTARADVAFQMSATSLVVTPGSEFEIVFRVSNASPAFNAFHMIVAYDPAALQAVKLSPSSLQVGPLVTGACGNNLHWFHMGAGLDTVDVSLLCPDATVAGPGDVYRMRFRASSVPQVTSLRVLPDAKFANAGVLLDDVTIPAAAIGIGEVPTLDAGGPPPPPIALSASPNPAAGDVRFDFARPLESEGTLAVHDCQGRLVRVLPLASGARSAAWDGRDATGLAAPSGVYVVALRSGSLLRSVRVTRLR